MSAARKLIFEVTERGGRLSLSEAGKVKVEAPAPLPDDLLTRLREMKDELALELAPAPHFDPVALQREADRRNEAARREGLTDRFCACGHLATLAYRTTHTDRKIWRCDDCGPPNGKEH
jgi:hypothetical protein